MKNIINSLVFIGCMIGLFFMFIKKNPPQAPVINHSFANLNDAVFTHLDWTADIRFDTKQIKAIARWQFQQKKHNTQLTVDINDLQVDRVIVNGRNVAFTIGQKQSYLGQPLTFDVTSGDSVVTFYYTTPATAQALQWLSPQQTTDKKMPYLFTQCESINTRSIIPAQDNPANRITYTAHLTVPAGMMAVMSANNPQQRNATGRYDFTMDIPVPTYLIALAVGDIDFKAIDARSGVYAEPSVLENAAAELNDIPKMIASAEQLAGPYRWGRYDVLIQPASFPIGGMENPKLTFATPTILAGDKSLVSLVAHELAHSWSGNTVTNATWSDLWLNEGFTTYFERRIMEALTDTSYTNMLWELSYQDMMSDLNDLGKTHPDTRLKLSLDGRDPEEAFTNIPYEKGAHLLWLIEKTVGRKTFDPFLVNYFNTHAFVPMTTQMALSFMRKQLLSQNPSWEKQIRLDEWVFQTGVPENCPRPDMTRFTAVDQYRAAGLQTGQYDITTTKNWTTHEWLQFLRFLPDSLSLAQIAQLDTVFHFTTTTNSEIAFAWYMHCIRHKYLPAYANIDLFLRRVGRKKFVKPLYQALYKSDAALAQKIFTQYRANYHPETKDAVESVLQ